jgi:hypothetical protein
VTEGRVQKLENKITGYTIAAGILGVASLLTVGQFFKVQRHVSTLDAQVDDLNKKASSIQEERDAGIKAINDHVPVALQDFSGKAPGLVKIEIDQQLAQYIEQQKQATSVFISTTCPQPWSRQISQTIMVFSEGADWNPKSLPLGWQESYGIQSWGGLGPQWHYVHVPICQRVSN